MGCFYCISQVSSVQYSGIILLRWASCIYKNCPIPEILRSQSVGTANQNIGNLTKILNKVSKPYAQEPLYEAICFSAKAMSVRFSVCLGFLS